MNLWKITLCIFLTLDVVGVVSLIRNAYVKVYVQGRTLGNWLSGLRIGSVVGTVIFGVPFFAASWLASSGQLIYLFLGLAIGTCMPLWLDCLLTLRHAIRADSYNAGKEGRQSSKFWQVLGLLVCLGVVFVVFLWLSFKAAP